MTLRDLLENARQNYGKIVMMMMKLKLMSRPGKFVLSHFITSTVTFYHSYTINSAYIIIIIIMYQSFNQSLLAITLHNKNLEMKTLREGLEKKLREQLVSCIDDDDDVDDYNDDDDDNE